MRIALVSEWLDPWRGGAETSTLQFLHSLMDSGAEVHVFTRSRPSPMPGLVVHTISGAAMSRSRRSITFAQRVEGRLVGNSFDVVHAISPCRHADVYQPRGGTVAESIQRNIALRRTAIGRSLKHYANYVNFKQHVMLNLERRILLDPNGPIVVALSDYVVRQLETHYDLPAQRIRKIFNGVDVHAVARAVDDSHRSALRHEFHVADSDCMALMVAHNFRLKGVHCWLEALARILARGVRNIRSVVVGKGDAPRWHRLAQRLGVNDHVAFVGPSDRVYSFYGAADCLVHPTFYDPCSRVVMEAMVAGLPCVTSRWDGAAELITDGVNGYRLDDPSDVDALADRVMRLRIKNEARRMGDAARGIAASVSMTRHTKELLDLYDQLSPLAKRRCDPRN